jgi:hypothetical protein
MKLTYEFDGYTNQFFPQIVRIIWPFLTILGQDFCSFLHYRNMAIQKDETCPIKVKKFCAKNQIS